MKPNNIFCLILILCIGSKTFSQAKKAVDTTGVDLLRKYLEKNIRIPKAASLNNISGQIILSFIYTADKVITDIKILKRLRNGYEEEVIRKLKSYQGVLNISPGNYTASITITTDDGGPPGKKGNYLFEANIHAYGSSLNYDYTIDRAYFIPQFNEHNGKLKSFVVSARVANKHGHPYKDSVYFQTDKKFNAREDITEEKTQKETNTPTINVFKYNDSNVLIEKSSYRKEAILMKQIYKYDKLGRKIEQRDSSTTDSNSNKRITYQYDNNGFLIAQQTFYPVNNERHTYKTIYQNNNEGLKISETTYNTNNEIVHQLVIIYHGSIKIAEEDYNNYNGSESKSLKYFEPGNLTTSYNYNEDGGVSGKTICKYDNANRLIEEVMYGAEGEALFKDIYKFDNDGNKIEEIMGVSKSYPGNRSTFIYSRYDKKGNWRKAKWTDANTHKQYVVTRQFTYSP